MTIEYLTAGEAARLLGVKPGTLLSYVRRNKLRARKVNASTNLYVATDVEALAADPPRPGNHTGRPRTKRTQPTEDER
jgi:excisionase family DNA binding protein